MIFVKAPEPGRVKTRLARDIGAIAATWWFRHQTRALIRRLARDPRWTTELAVAPDRAAGARHWPAHVARRPQGPGDLGDRMGRVLRGAPPGPIAIVGGDIPGIRSGHIAAAFRALGRAEAVLGPAPDGGFWLIGLRRGGRAIPAGLFRGVRWSSADALADTAASLAPLTVGHAATLADVDTGADLTQLRAKNRRSAARGR